MLVTGTFIDFHILELYFIRTAWYTQSLMMRALTVLTGGVLLSL